MTNAFKAAGWAVVVSLLGSNACRADEILFSEAASKCLQNHADPERVLSAADATGWHGVATKLDELAGTKVNPHVRLKDADGGQLYLKVDASQRSGEMVRSCSIMGMFKSWADTLKAAQSYFGVPPSQDQQVQTDKPLDIDQPVQVVQWVYIERDGQRSYLKGDQLKHVEDLMGAGVVHAVSLVHSAAREPTQANPVEVLDKEISKAGPP